MKKKNLAVKLSLKKKTITSLNENSTGRVVGGGILSINACPLSWNACQPSWDGGCPSHLSGCPMCPTGAAVCQES